MVESMLLSIIMIAISLYSKRWTKWSSILSLLERKNGDQETPRSGDVSLRLFVIARWWEVSRDKASMQGWNGAMKELMMWFDYRRKLHRLSGISSRDFFGVPLCHHAAATRNIEAIQKANSLGRRFFFVSSKFLTIYRQGRTCGALRKEEGGKHLRFSINIEILTSLSKSFDSLL